MFNPSKNKDGIIPNTESNNFKRGTGEGDFLKLYQDPTSIGFKLFFINISDATYKSNEGTQTTIQSASTINSTGLFGNVGDTNSALYYLKSIGDNARFDMLVDFKKLLSKLNTDYPWYFQSIDGLNEAWSRDYKMPKFKKEVTITCLESIDLRITALMDLYRKIAFDWTNRRVILPDNLRKFELSIKIYDIRNFQKDPDKYKPKSEKDVRNENKALQNSEFLGEDWSVTNQVTFNLTHCEFMPDESGNMFSTISNNSYDNAAQSIKISYENIEEDNIYRSLIALGNGSHYYVRDYLRKELEALKGGQDIDGGDSFNKFGIPSIAGADNPNFQQKINAGVSDARQQVRDIDLNSELDSVYADIQTNVSSAAANLVQSRLSSLYLGNVFGFSGSEIINTGRNAVTTAHSNALGNAFGDI